MVVFRKHWVLKNVFHCRRDQINILNKTLFPSTNNPKTGGVKSEDEAFKGKQEAAEQRKHLIISK